ncbi:hypothetical protein Taro_023206 [Colocasia esculenta]|uniref:Uncharacterized protein n=1 Tax=Colocasia esculenta TaxID=4460 RepID=A0A843UWQ8_COLES|nr:hypothetical protein [Colocasia esculenta]
MAALLLPTTNKWGRKWDYLPLPFLFRMEKEPDTRGTLKTFPFPHLFGNNSHRNPIPTITGAPRSGENRFPNTPAVCPTTGRGGDRAELLCVVRPARQVDREREEWQK